MVSVDNMERVRNHYRKNRDSYLENRPGQYFLISGFSCEETFFDRNRDLKRELDKYGIGASFIAGRIPHKNQAVRNFLKWTAGFVLAGSAITFAVSSYRDSERSAFENSVESSGVALESVVDSGKILDVNGDGRDDYFVLIGDKDSADSYKIVLRK